MTKEELKEPALQVHQLTVNYDKTPVLWDLSLEVPKQKMVGILGPNGAGKSTFIKSALGLVKPLSGKIEFFGEGLKKMRKRIAYVPQREAVDWDFPITVLDLVLMGRYGKLGLFRRPKREDIEAARHSLEIVGLSEFANRQISQLSGGQQQRAFLARALLQDADIYFLDEPFAGVDQTTEKILVERMWKLRDEGKTLFIVHHDLNTVESYFDWVILLNMRLVSCGPTQEAYNQSALEAAYGKNRALFSEATKLSQGRTSGLV